jgi:hypothetical protein
LDRVQKDLWHRFRIRLGCMMRCLCIGFVFFRTLQRSAPIAFVQKRSRRCVQCRLTVVIRLWFWCTTASSHNIYRGASEHWIFVLKFISGDEVCFQFFLQIAFKNAGQVSHPLSKERLVSHSFSYSVGGGDLLLYSCFISSHHINSK